MNDAIAIARVNRPAQLGLPGLGGALEQPRTRPRSGSAQRVPVKLLDVRPFRPAADARTSAAAASSSGPPLSLCSEDLADLANRVASSTTLTVEEARRGIAAAFTVFECRAEVETLITEFIAACRI